MLKVLFITASSDTTGKSNVGDRVILAGVRNLIAGAFGVYAYREVGRWAKSYEPADNFDLVVYAGMPQYGSRSGPTAVEKTFQAYLDSAKSAVFLNIGGGTPAGIDFDVEGVSTRMAQSGIGPFYAAQKGIAYRTTRDLVGTRFFNKLGVQCDLRPCPSFFSTLHVQPAAKTRDAIAFISDDTFVTNRVRGSMTEHLRRLIGRLKGAELAAHSHGDLTQLGRFGDEHIYFRSELDAIEYYSTVRRLAALRIHAGVPCWTLGGDVVVGAFDNRAQMFADVGMPIPVIDLVRNDFTRLGDMLDDSSLHMPFDKRLDLINTAYAGFTSALREAVPTLASRAETAAGALPEGFSVYPLDGKVAVEGARMRPNRLDLKPEFVPEDPAGPRGVVVIPKGAIARAGVAADIELPIRHKGAAFSSTTGAVSGDAMTVSLDRKAGQLGRAPQMRVPFGMYRMRMKVRHLAPEAGLKGTKATLVLLVKNNHTSYGEDVRVVGDTAFDGSVQEFAVTFENAYPSAAILADLVLRSGSAKASVAIEELSLEPA